MVGMTVQEAFPAPAAIQQHVKPDERRVLLAWLDDLFGCESNRAILTRLKGAIGGFHTSCCTFIIGKRGKAEEFKLSDRGDIEGNILRE